MDVSDAASAGADGGFGVVVVVGVGFGGIDGIIDGVIDGGRGGCGCFGLCWGW